MYWRETEGSAGRALAAQPIGQGGELLVEGDRVAGDLVGDPSLAGAELVEVGRSVARRFGRFGRFGRERLELGPEGGQPLFLGLQAARQLVELIGERGRQLGEPGVDPVTVGDALLL